jgi:alkylglycerol monooxygenase
MPKGLSPIALAVPFFFLLILVELGISKLIKKPVYRFADTLTDLSCGILQQLLGLAARTVLAFGYLWLYEHARIFEIPGDAVWAWVAIFFGVDFFYYWFHRMSHERPLLWAAHVVHHQSEEYNLAVALRQDAFQPFFSWVFYLPLAVLGFPPAMFFLMIALNTLYQFWIHTRLIRSLGPLEWILNTPAHHRVHHGRNPKYMDRNHGGTLIVWDMLFGTFQREEEEPVYGVTKQLGSWNPVWANFDPYLALLQRSRGVDGLFAKIKVWWGKATRAELEAAAAEAKYDRYAPSVTRGRMAYAMIQFLLALLGSLALIGGAPLVPAAKVALGFAVALALVSVGLLLEGRSHASRFELARVGITVLGVAYFALA